MQRDPIGYWGDLNLYRYCSNNPVNWVDAFGLDKEKSNKGLFPEGYMYGPDGEPIGPTGPKVEPISPAPLENKFRIRTVAGAGGGVILGGEFTTFEIEDVATGRRQFYSFVGAGAAFGGKVGGSGPSQWTTFYTQRHGLTEQSFHGYAIVTWIGGKAGVGGGIINIDWVTGPASGENVAGIGWETGLAGGAQSSHGGMFRR